MKSTFRILMGGFACLSLLGGCTADVTGPDRRPVAKAGFDTTVSVNQEVILDGSSSWDPDGDPLSYSWRLLSIPSGSKVQMENGPTTNLAPSQASFTPDVAGSFIAGLVVSAKGLDSRMDVVRITAGRSTCTTDSQCDDGLFCNGSERCVDSKCQAGPAPDCSSLDGPCTKGVCNEHAAQCETQDLPQGTACDDGLFCTVDTTCDDHGQCQGGSPRDCSASGGSCVSGTCNEETDSCEGVATPADTPCDDGRFCTIGETCDGQGLCQGGSLRDCSASGGSCISGTCNEETDSCEGDALPADTPCDDGSQEPAAVSARKEIGGQVVVVVREEDSSWKHNPYP